MTPSSKRRSASSGRFLWPAAAAEFHGILGIAFATSPIPAPLRRRDGCSWSTSASAADHALGLARFAPRAPPRYPIGRMGWVPLLNAAKGALLLAICLNGLAEAARAVIDGGEEVDFPPAGDSTP